MVPDWDLYFLHFPDRILFDNPPLNSLIQDGLENSQLVVERPGRVLLKRIDLKFLDDTGIQLIDSFDSLPGEELPNRFQMVVLCLIGRFRIGGLVVVKIPYENRSYQRRLKLFERSAGESPLEQFMLEIGFQ